MKITDIYHFVRKILFEILLYFLLQGLLLTVLAVLIIVYPQTLNILFALGFLIIAIVSLYLTVRIALLFHQVKKVKKTLLKK